MSDVKNTSHLDDEINRAALKYHAEPIPGKISVELTKPTKTQADLALAYTPGVAEPVRKIAENPEDAYKYTCKGNLVAVITDGTAVLGLGNVGSLAGKPVMEGKGVLFKHFAGIDVFDIEVDAENPQDFIDTVARISPTFGGINLEDIAAPHCFEIEKALVEKLNIPVFHDDQHGTAIIIAAGLMNALELQGKTLETPANIFVLDRKGVLHTGRTDLNPYKASVAVETDKRTLDDAMQDADVFIGVSGPDLVSESMLASMAARPIVFALSNPVPEIRPDRAFSVRDDLIMATGRSDYPNQVNNVLGFPFIFRGALDVRATCINDEMQIAAVMALKDLTLEPVPAEVLAAYNLQSLKFGVDYILPKPLDGRLKQAVSSAVAKAAIDSGVAQKGWPADYPAI
jgi:malate dehydrogenase (oxaloacetate-decarboxylating)(NADP+)